MEFKTKDETAGAMWIVLRHLEDLVRRIEDGVCEAGLVIEDKRIEQSDNGTACPVLRVRTRRRCSGGWVIELGLRNALDELLAVDRDEEPARLDLQLFDDAYAEEKLAGIVEGRVSLVRAISGSRDAAEARARLRKLAPKFERLSVWEREERRRGRH